MRIRTVETLATTVGGRGNFVYVKLVTDEGIVGYGEASCLDKERALFGADIEVPKDGYLTVPTGPGWGVQPDEDFLRAHPLQPVGRFPMQFAEDGSIVNL